MPEGPEIRRAADALSDAIAGLSIDHVRLPYHRLRPFGPRFRGQRITTFRTHGKALLTNFDNGWTIYSHNQLYGLWQVARPKRSTTARSGTATRVGPSRPLHPTLQRNGY